MIEFNGQQYASLKEWERAYPVYGPHYAQYVKAGAKTPMEIEQMVYERKRAAHKKRDAAPNPLRKNIDGLAGRKKGRKA